MSILHLRGSTKKGRRSLGLLPALRDRELMMGMKMPPARAVVEGMAGAMRASATDKPYARPSVLFPNNFTNSWATRSPSPVFSKPLAKKKDTTISQITSLVNALNAAAKVKVFVATATVTAMKAQAPTGRGSSTRPAMVETKMDSRVHPWALIPTGAGTKNCSARPREMESTSGRGLAPGHTGPGAAGAGTAAAAAAEARTGVTDRPRATERSASFLRGRTTAGRKELQQISEFGCHEGDRWTLQTWVTKWTALSG